MRGWNERVVNALESQAAGLAAAAEPGKTVNVGVGSTLLAVANTARKRLLIINMTAGVRIEVWHGAAGTIGTGIPLAPAADALTPGGFDEVLGSQYTGAIYAKASSAAGTNDVRVTED